MRLRRYLVAGLLIWLPVVVTILVFKVLLDLVDQVLLLIPHDYRPETLLGPQVVAWGDNSEGQATSPESLPGKAATAVAASDFHNLALTSDGQVTAWVATTLGRPPCRSR